MFDKENAISDQQADQTLLTESEYSDESEDTDLSGFVVSDSDRSHNTDHIMEEISIH